MSTHQPSSPQSAAPLDIQAHRANDILKIVLSSEAMANDPGPRCLGRVMQRLYDSGRLYGRFPALLAGPLLETLSQHNLKFFLPPRDATGDPLPLSDSSARRIIALIVGGFFAFRDRCSRKDGWETFVENIQDIERNGHDIHDALCGSPYVHPTAE